MQGAYDHHRLAAKAAAQELDQARLSSVYTLASSLLDKVGSYEQASPDSEPGPHLGRGVRLPPRRGRRRPEPAGMSMGSPFCGLRAVRAVYRPQARRSRRHPATGPRRRHSPQSSPEPPGNCSRTSSGRPAPARKRAALSALKRVRATRRRACRKTDPLGVTRSALPVAEDPCQEAADTHRVPSRCCPALPEQRQHRVLAGVYRCLPGTRHPDGRLVHWPIRSVEVRA